MKSCTTLWNPDKEEQRFCWSCQQWFHIACLSGPVIPQHQHLQSKLALHPNTPANILPVAYQPTARGGQQHFIAGNIRIVKLARWLLDDKNRQALLSAADPWIVGHLVEHSSSDDPWEPSDMWIEYMQDKHGIDQSTQEQLLNAEQIMYLCPNSCGPGSWV